MSAPSLPIRIVLLALMIAITVVVLFPVYAVVLMSVSKAPGFSIVAAPDWGALTLDHFARFVAHTDAEGRWLFWRQLFNSLIVASAATLLGITLSTTAAYAFSRMRFPGHRAAMGMFLVTQMFPATMMVVPLYLLINRLGLVDSTAGLVVVYSTTSLPFCIWMLKGYFDTIPTDLDEAALIDGASRWRVFYQVVLPLARPAIAVTALFSFLSAWNEFILAATFLSRQEAFTLPVTLYRNVGGHGADWGAFAAGSIIVSIPVCALFFFLQKNLVGGLSAGAVK